MKHRRRHTHREPARVGPDRGGSTLTEVLMSILAMAIGLVMVATIFPVTILRSINATKLTRGTIHRFNAESYVDLLPRRLVHDPDFNGNVREHFPTLAQRNARLTNNYIVDPLGWELIRRDTDIPTANTFGLLQRYNGFNIRTAALTTLQFAYAEALVVSPDSWPKPDGFENEYTVTGVTGTSATLDGIGAADLSQVDISAAGRSRIVLFDATGRFSLVRELNSAGAVAPVPVGISGTTANWAATDPLPPAWTPGNPAHRHTVTTARIETKAQHFTWLLTVRNNGQVVGVNDARSANVDVVVFFKRQFTQQTERVFALTQPVAINRRRYQLDLTAVPADSRPLLKKGLYICDVIHGRWYRIQRIVNANSTTPQIWLETNPPAPNPTTPEVVTQAIFMPGIVEVYPLGTK